MANEQLKKKQEELDSEEAICPECGGKTTWGEIREFGTCLDCYYEYEKKENKKKGPIDEQESDLPGESNY